MTSEEVLGMFGRQFGEAMADARDRQFVDMWNRLYDPDAYWKPELTYKGIGAKRRLYMKLEAESSG